MHAQDVMTKDVAVVRRDTAIADAIHRMVDRKISGLPVVDEAGHVIGIVSEGDLLRRVELGTEKRAPRWLKFLRGPTRDAADFVRARTQHVSDVMTRDPVTVDAHAPLEEVVDLMTRRRVRRLPVTEGGCLVGIVSRADLVRTLARALEIRTTVRRPDESIRDDIRAAIEAESWAASCSVSVRVHDGFVVIAGTVFLDGIDTALKVAAECVEGVRGVECKVEFLAPAPMGV
jgi:CBS domain-containing protein